MATTLAAIRDRLVVVIEAATPTNAPCDAASLFRYKPEREFSLTEWCAANASACFRRFEIKRSSGTSDDPGILHPDEVQRTDEQLTITVAYPRLPDLYGEGYEAMEDCLRADARQIRDLCLSGSTYSTVSGWSGVLQTVIEAPSREGVVWFQDITITLAYCESQSLT